MLWFPIETNWTVSSNSWMSWGYPHFSFVWDCRNVMKTPSVAVPRTANANSLGIWRLTHWVETYTNSETLPHPPKKNNSNFYIHLTGHARGWVTVIFSSALDLVWQHGLAALNAVLLRFCHLRIDFTKFVPWEKCFRGPPSSPPVCLRLNIPFPAGI